MVIEPEKCWEIPPTDGRVTLMRREIGRLKIETYADMSGTTLKLREGQTEYTDWRSFDLSLEELHDLRHMVDRQIVHIESGRGIHR